VLSGQLAAEGRQTGKGRGLAGGGWEEANR